MARLLPILTALGRITFRDLKQLGSVAGNNFFLFAFLALSQSGGFIQLLLGLVVLFPLSSDPLRRAPAERLALWPLSMRDRVLLRVLSLLLSPPVWITLILLIWARKPAPAAMLFAAAAVFHGLTSLFSAIPARAPKLNVLRYVPAFGLSIGGLVQKNLREILCILDFYVAVLLAISGVLYRMLGSSPDPDAFMMMALLTVLALSTHALTLFGLDTASGLTRYRLLPLRGWQILAAKGVAFVVVCVALTAGLAPAAGFAAALMALAVGHHNSIRHPVAQTRWRFTGGAPLSSGLVQAFCMFSAGTLAYRSTLLVEPVCLAFYCGSLWFYGRDLENRNDGNCLK